MLSTVFSAVNLSKRTSPNECLSHEKKSGLSGIECGFGLVLSSCTVSKRVFFCMFPCSIFYPMADAIRSLRSFVCSEKERDDYKGLIFLGSTQSTVAGASPSSNSSGPPLVRVRACTKALFLCSKYRSTGPSAQARVRPWLLRLPGLPGLWPACRCA